MRFALVLCTAAALCAPMTVVGAQTEKPFAAFSNSAQSIRDSVVQMAKAQLGRRYRTGGQTPERGFDCSGLVAYVMQALNLAAAAHRKAAGQRGTRGHEGYQPPSPRRPPDVRQDQEEQHQPHRHLCRRRPVHPRQQRGRQGDRERDRSPVLPLIKGWRGARRIVAGEDSIPAIAVIAPTPGKGNPYLVVS